MQDTSLLRKLGIKPGNKLVLINAPDDFLARIDPLPEDVVLAVSNGDLGIAFVDSQEALQKIFPKAVDSIAPNASIWIAFPKKTSRLRTDINRDEGWSVVRSAGFESMVLISLDETWSAFRFKRVAQMRDRSSKPVSSSSEIAIPDDMTEVLADNDSANAAFARLSPSHKKEYLQWIGEAKKPETRQRRLHKSVEMLAEGKSLR